MKNAGANATSCMDGTLIDGVSPNVTACQGNVSGIEANASCSVFTINLNSNDNDYDEIKTMGNNSEELDLCVRAGYCFDNTCNTTESYISFYDFRVNVTGTYGEAEFGLTPAISVSSPTMGDFDEAKTSSFTGEAYLCDPDNRSKYNSSAPTFEVGQGKCNDISPVAN